MVGGERSGGGGRKRTCTCELLLHFPDLSLIIGNGPIWPKSIFPHCILMHMPLKWKPANHDLSSRRSPTINGMKSAPPRTCASSSLVESCCCNFARVWLLPLLGQPNRVRRHDLSLATGRWDTWQVPPPNLIRSKHLPWTNRGCPTAPLHKSTAIRGQPRPPRQRCGKRLRIRSLAPLGPISHKKQKSTKIILGREI